MPVKEKHQLEIETELRSTDPTLPELLGSITSRLLTALENADVAAKQAEMNACRKDLQRWYENFPAEKRKEMAKDLKRIMTNYKNIGEQLYFDLVGLTAQDL